MSIAFRDYPGWHGAHTRTEAPGALRNGTRVHKIATEDGDTHPVGSKATILGSVHVPERGYAYFVEWDDSPRYAVLVVAGKIRQL